MTYSQFQFLPLQVVTSSSFKRSDARTVSAAGDSAETSSQTEDDRYRLLKFTDARDPRHKHLYPISGSMIENYNTQVNPKSRNKSTGKVLEFSDNWCLLPRAGEENEQQQPQRDAPYPHRGHPVLYVPGHWGSFSQARSIGAHGTRWTGHAARSKSDQDVYNSLLTGKGMNDGNSDRALDELLSGLHSSTSSELDFFVMDVFALDFDGGEGAALHSSKLLRQAEFFARAVETIVKGCQNSGQKGITIVAHSIGAWVVRIALRMHPHLTSEGWVRNVITLASPLASIPFAVDAGVHDIMKHLNDGDVSDGDVTIISVSGGLRDEMIPPELCEVPSSRSHTTKSKADEGITSSTQVINEAFLSVSAMSTTKQPLAGNAFGMDHRAIVWCYELLKTVREVIFVMVVATDRGIVSSERMEVARKIMKINDNQQTGASSSFRDDVMNQRVALVQEKGYATTVTIQLASPYRLNSLLKICILVALLHSHVTLPLIGLSSRTTALHILLVPLIVTATAWIRRSTASCYMQECQMLLGTTFILAQLAMSAYFLICYGICLILAYLRRKFFHAATTTDVHLQAQSFGHVFLHCFMQQLKAYALVVVLVTAAVYYIHTRLLGGNADFVWNRVAVTSYFFVSTVVLLISSIINVACSSDSSDHHRTIMFVLLLSIIKVTYGKVIYALSLITNWGQIDSQLYDEFLKTMNSSVGSMIGHHKEMILCVATYLVPTFAAVVVIQTHTIMVRNWNLHFSKSLSKADDGDTDQSLNKASLGHGDRIAILVADVSVVVWYAWNAFVSYGRDDMLVPLYTFATFASFYLRCIPLSSKAMGVYSAVVDNDLSLCSNSPKDHNKKE